MLQAKDRKHQIKQAFFDAAQNALVIDNRAFQLCDIKRVVISMPDPRKCNEETLRDIWIRYKNRDENVINESGFYSQIYLGQTDRNSNITKTIKDKVHEAGIPLLEI